MQFAAGSCVRRDLDPGFVTSLRSDPPRDDGRCGIHIHHSSGWHYYAAARASCGQQAPAPVGDTLLPAAMTERLVPKVQQPKDEDAELDANAVFAKLSALKGKRDDEEE